MLVTEYLKKNGLKALTDNYGIKVNTYADEDGTGLYVLNYCQINSPKNDPIVSECRSLILDFNFNVVSRSFDRFFNYGEMPETQTHIDMSKAILYEKVDGSLIKIYWWKGKWHVATRSTAFAESKVNGFDLTFKDLVLKALSSFSFLTIDEQEFQAKCDEWLDPDLTWIFEVTAMENRVVTRYDGYQLHFLSARNNRNGEYDDTLEADLRAEYFGARRVGRAYFHSVEDCIEVAKNLPDLAEGYVLYQYGIPVCKIKSPAYVAVHHLRGEGLNPKRISELVLTGEEEEYLKYYPEDREHILPYVIALDNLKKDMAWKMLETEKITDQKNFALAVKDLLYSSVLFRAKKSGELLGKVWNAMPDSYKLKLLMEVVK